MPTTDLGPDPTRRAALVALLEERARLLQPSAEVVGRALRRCVRHELRAQKRTQGEPLSGSRTPTPGNLIDPAPASAAEAPSTAAAPAVDAAPAPDPAPAAIAVAVAAIAVAPAPPAPVDDHGLHEPIDTAVARARTVSDTEGEPHPAPPTGLVTAPTTATAAAPAEPRPVTNVPAAGEAPRKGRRPPRVLEPGRVIGGYRIEKLLGSGGMGQVYRALQLSMNRPVALKVLAPRFVRNARFRERFLREARAAGRLQHPNLIAVHDVGEADGLLYFSMELVDGSSLKDVLGELGTLPEDRAREFARQTLEALRYAHERSIVHRDIKPDNLMVTTQGVVKVADLGLSRSDNDDDDGDEFTTKTGTMMGTPYYMPPEQGRDAHRADARSDLYAVGATLYHLVCGKVPFEGETAVAILINATTQPLTWPEPGPGPAMRRFIAALMAKKPADRPRSASEALAMLRALDGSARDGERPAGSISARTRVSGRPAAQRAVRRRRRMVAIVIAILAAVVILAGLVALARALAAKPMRDLREQVGALQAAHRHAAALAEIDLMRERVGDRPELTALRRSAIDAWDAWAKAQAMPAISAFDSALAARRWSDAAQALDGIDEAWRSPGLLAALDEREARLEQERSAAEAPDDRRSRMQSALDAWVAVLFAGKGEVRGSTVRLEGAGETVLAARLRDRPVLPPLQLTVQYPRGARSEDQLVVAFAPGRELRLSPAGAVVVANHKSTRVADSDDDGRVSVTLVHRQVGSEVEIGIPDGDPGAGVRLAVDGPPRLSWSIGAGRSAELAMAMWIKGIRRPTTP